MDATDSGRGRLGGMCDFMGRSVVVGGGGWGWAIEGGGGGGGRLKGGG